MNWKGFSIEDLLMILGGLFGIVATWFRMESKISIIEKTYVSKDDHVLMNRDTETKINRIDTNVTRIMERLEMNNTH